MNDSRPYRLVRERDLPTYAGLRRTQIAELIKRGEFPRPIRLSDGGRAKAWLEDELASQGTERVPRCSRQSPPRAGAELFAFPRGRHDDQVDSISQALGHEFQAYWTKESLDNFNKSMTTLWQDAAFARLAGRPW